MQIILGIYEAIIWAIFFICVGGVICFFSLFYLAIKSERKNFPTMGKDGV